MEHELKIIMGSTPMQTIVMIDNQPIGLIQDIKFHVGVDSAESEIEIVFPDFFSGDLDPLYVATSPFIKELQHTLEILKEMPHVKVRLEKLQFPEQ